MRWRFISEKPIRITFVPLPLMSGLLPGPIVDGRSVSSLSVSSEAPSAAIWHIGLVGLQLHNITHLVASLPGRNKADQDHSDHTFPDKNRFADFEPRFVRAVYQSSAWCFLHLSILRTIHVGDSGREMHLTR
jgi:hypothetical protein